MFKRSPLCNTDLAARRAGRKQGAISARQGIDEHVLLVYIRSSNRRSCGGPLKRVIANRQRRCRVFIEFREEGHTGCGQRVSRAGLRP